MKILSIIFILFNTIHLFGQNLHPYPMNEDQNLAWFEPACTPYSVGKYEKLEIGISLPEEIQYRIENFLFKGQSPKSINPYLSWEIKVVANFYYNGELMKSADGFFYQEFDRNLSNPNIYDRTWENKGTSYGRQNADFNFRVRTALDKIGKWSCEIKVILPDKELLFNKINFEVTESPNKGFIEVGKNKRYFTLNNETFYFVGQNVNWPNKSGACINQNGVAANLCQPFIDDDLYCTSGMYPPDAYINFYKQLDSLSKNVNFVRTMMVPWSWDFEYEKVGNYTSRLNIAWEMDRFFDLCHEKGIYVNFDLSWGAEFANPNVYGGAQWDWYDHPEDQISSRDERFYNYKTKFNLETFYDFKVNPEVRKYYAEKLRYFVARYGYSTNLAIIEVMNEMNGKEYETIEGRTSTREWHDFVTTYLKDSLHVNQLTAANYGNGYEVCTQNNICSGGTSDSDFSYNLKNVDVASYNFYVAPSPSKHLGLAMRFNKEHLGREKNIWYHNLDKPVIIGETGFYVDYNICAPDYFDGYDHAVMLSMAGFAGILIWDYKPEYFPKYKLITQFMNSFDLDGLNFQPYLPNYASKYDYKIFNELIRKDEKLDFLYLKSTQRNPEVIGLIHNRTFNAYSARNSFFDDGYDANGNSLPSKDKWKDTLKCAGTNLNIPCDDLAWDSWNNQPKYGKYPYEKGTTVTEEKGQKLRIKNLDFGNFTFNYYNAINLNHIGQHEENGLFKTLHHPPLEESNRLTFFTASSIFSKSQFKLNQTSAKIESKKSIDISIEIVNKSLIYVSSAQKTERLNYELYDSLGTLIQNAVLDKSENKITVIKEGVLQLFILKEGEILAHKEISF